MWSTFQNNLQSIFGFLEDDVFGYEKVEEERSRTRNWSEYLAIGKLKLHQKRRRTGFIHLQIPMSSGRNPNSTRTFWVHFLKQQLAKNGCYSKKEVLTQKIIQRHSVPTRQLQMGSEVVLGTYSCQPTLFKVPAVGEQLFHKTERFTVRTCVGEGQHEIVGCITKRRKVA